ncbi:hypothetical protein [Nitrosomonas sp. Nm34]|uniref:hypothetical protein n=1 Tax=Nitrosomonas sp. Nm34 TaxID=1881055 RepID=UPI0020C83FBA|nr:hypothetical protein [Nitrosomonas sp. Nm34]
MCVGFGAIKTLAKLANHIAKKQPEFNGVCDLAAIPSSQLDALLTAIEVGEVWGVGTKYQPAFKCNRYLYQNRIYQSLT